MLIGEQHINTRFLITLVGEQHSNSKHREKRPLEAPYVNTPCDVRRWKDSKTTKFKLT
jgi:hypothetical protein